MAVGVQFNNFEFSLYCIIDIDSGSISIKNQQLYDQ